MAESRRILTALALVVLLLGSLLPGAGRAKEIGQLELEAPSALLMDVTTGSVLYETEADQVRKPASITKIMTMILVYEALDKGQISLEEEVVASAEATKWGGSQIYLETGEVMTVEDLLLSVVVGSANDASVALGEHVAGSHRSFVEAMNQKALELGLTSTTFRNAHGLDDDGQLTSARDVALMSRYLITRFPQALELARIWDDYVRAGQENEFWLVNTNRLIMDYPGADGLKTGWTPEAGFCVAGTAARGDTRLIAVVMGAETSSARFRDASSLLNWGFANYETVMVARKGEALEEVKVTRGQVDRVKVSAARDAAVTVEKGKGEELQVTLDLQEWVTAPLEKGQVLGQLRVEMEGQELASVEVLAANGVRRASILQLWQRILMDFWPFF